jgi:hypothetical protein
MILVSTKVLLVLVSTSMKSAKGLTLTLEKKVNLKNLLIGGSFFQKTLFFFSLLHNLMLGVIENDNSRSNVFIMLTS